MKLLTGARQEVYGYNEIYTGIFKTLKYNINVYRKIEEGVCMPVRMLSYDIVRPLFEKLRTGNI